MQAAPSTDMHSEHAQPSAAASSEATHAGAASADDDIAAALVPGAVADVEELCGVRVNVDDLGQPLVEYLVHWKVSNAASEQRIVPHITSIVPRVEA